MAAHTNLGGASQKIKQTKDKKKHKAVIKEKRKKNLLPEKEEPEKEDWEDEEDEEDEEAENGLFDMEAEESEDEESEDEGMIVVRALSAMIRAATRLTHILTEDISSSAYERKRHRLRIRG